MFKEQKKHWVEKQQKLKVKEESKECTYQPKINEMSRNIVIFLNDRYYVFDNMVLWNSSYKKDTYS